MYIISNKLKKAIIFTLLWHKKQPKLWIALFYYFYLTTIVKSPYTVPLSLLIALTITVPDLINLTTFPSIVATLSSLIVYINE